MTILRLLSQTHSGGIAEFAPWTGFGWYLGVDPESPDQDQPDRSK